MLDEVRPRFTRRRSPRRLFRPIVAPAAGAVSRAARAAGAACSDDLPRCRLGRRPQGERPPALAGRLGMRWLCCRRGRPAGRARGAGRATPPAIRAVRPGSRWRPSCDPIAGTAPRQRRRHRRGFAAWPSTGGAARLGPVGPGCGRWRGVGVGAAGRSRARIILSLAPGTPGCGLAVRSTACRPWCSQQVRRPECGMPEAGLPRRTRPATGEPRCRHGATV